MFKRFAITRIIIAQDENIFSHEQHFQVPRWNGVTASDLQLTQFSVPQPIFIFIINIKQCEGIITELSHNLEEGNSNTQEVACN